jgi:hypothetical protein
MIENPTKQIIHPDSIISTIEISRDTIAIAYNRAFVSDGWGPISRPFPLEIEKEYKAVRVLIENTYSFSEFYTNSTEIIDYWIRPSSSNAIIKNNDTTKFLGYGEPANTLYTYTDFNFFDAEPYVEILQFDTINKIIKTRGYYYNFINKFLDVVLNNAGTTNESIEENPFGSINEWYPINPFVDTAKIPVSIYIKDTSLTTFYKSICNSPNALFDETTNLDDIKKELKIEVFPNPTDNTITILSFQEEISKIKIVDIQGKSVFDSPINSKQKTLELYHLKPGLYILICETEIGILKQKIIKT